MEQLEARLFVEPTHISMPQACVLDFVQGFKAATGGLAGLQMYIAGEESSVESAKSFFTEADWIFRCHRHHHGMRGNHRWKRDFFAYRSIHGKPLP